jgi:hypothetical protein
VRRQRLAGKRHGWARVPPIGPKRSWPGGISSHVAIAIFGYVDVVTDFTTWQTLLRWTLAMTLPWPGDVLLGPGRRRSGTPMTRAIIRPIRKGVARQIRWLP